MQLTAPDTVRPGCMFQTILMQLETEVWQRYCSCQEGWLLFEGSQGPGASNMREERLIASLFFPRARSHSLRQRGRTIGDADSGHALMRCASKGQCAMPVARLLPPGLLGDGWGSSLIIIAWVLKLSSTNDTCVPHLPPMLCRTVYAHSIPARCPSVSRSLRDFFAHFPHARVGPLARAGGGCRDVG